MLDIYFKNDEKYTKKYGEQTIFLMQCGSFFEVYSYKNKQGNFINNKITDFSKICDMAIAVKHGKYKGRQIYMAGFSPIERLEKYVKKLTDKGYTVPVFIQDVNLPDQRYEHAVFSPGTNFDMESTKITNNLMVIWIDNYKKTTINKTPVIHCGMACIDIFSGNNYLFQFKNNYLKNPITYDEIERFYSSYNPNEIIIISNNSKKEIKEIINFTQIDCETIHIISREENDTPYNDLVEKCDSQKYQKEILEKFYNVNDFASFYEEMKFREYPTATQAFCFLLSFAYEHNPALVKNIAEPEINNINKRLILGNHSLKQLNMIPNGDMKGKLSSVVTFLNRCRTPMGKRKLKHLMLNPKNDEKWLKKEYKIVEHAINENEVFDKIRNELKEMNDMERLYRKIILKRIVPTEYVKLYKDVCLIRKINNRMKKNKKLKEYNKGIEVQKNSKRLIKFLEENLIMDVAVQINSTRFEKNIFKKGIYKDIDEAEMKYKESYDKIVAIQKNFELLIDEKKRNIKNSLIKIHETEKNGIYLSITDRRMKLLKIGIKKYTEKCGINEMIIKYKSSYDGSEKEFIYDFNNLMFSSATSSNKKLDGSIISNMYSSVRVEKHNFKDELRRCYNDFISKTENYPNELDNLIKYVINLDIISTKAFLAKEYHYVCPKIKKKEKSFIEAKGIRHILIEQIQMDEFYVPNDINLGIDYNGSLLYGTNAVGKSSLIKSVGICLILAQSGFYVPCSDFIYSPYESIYTRILGNDNLFKGLSTFAVEMSELSAILKNGNKNTLILGDEVCSGTETSSAVSIFASAIIKLNEKNSSFIFATHFHELTKMDEIINLEKVIMQHMTVHYDRTLDALVYDRKLKSGSGNSMYGLEVCKSLNMPKDFLELAQKFRSKVSPIDNTVLSFGVSKYNSNKVKGICEICDKKIGEEVHHLIPQEFSGENGWIEGVGNKNNKANLSNICKECHKELTKSKKKMRRKKTTKGMIMVECQ